MIVFGSDDDLTDWAAYGREAFMQNWRKRMEKAEAELNREARRARDVESGLRAMVDRPHNHGSPDCLTCQWNTRIYALLECDRA